MARHDLIGALDGLLRETRSMERGEAARHIADSLLSSSQSLSVGRMNGRELIEHAHKNPSPEARETIDELIEASRWLSFCAMTSGGTAGTDAGLMKASARVETAIAALSTYPEGLEGLSLSCSLGTGQRPETSGGGQ